MSHVTNNRNSKWTHAAQLVLVGLFLVGGGCTAERPASESATTTREKGVQVMWSFQEDRFWTSLERAQTVDRIAESAHGMIVPHHELASDVIARAFTTVEGRPVRRVIVMGPNHEERGSGKVISGVVDWTVGSERLESDRALIELLEQKGVVVKEPNALVEEHAIGTLTPYIAHTWPEAEIVPVALSSRLHMEEALVLGRELSAFLDEETMLILSIDFSHYLPLSAANRHDEETREAMIGRDYGAIASMTSDHLDSAPGLIAFLEAMQQKNAELLVLEHTNSALLEGKDVPETTSYFTILAQ